MLKVGLTTLGCKVNQCDSAALAENLQSAGFSLVPFGAFADAYVINTCTVTAFADFQARQLIRIGQFLVQRGIVFKDRQIHIRHQFQQRAVLRNFLLVHG